MMERFFRPDSPSRCFFINHRHTQTTSDKNIKNSMLCEIHNVLVVSKYNNAAVWQSTSGGYILGFIKSFVYLLNREVVRGFSKSLS